jgi:hypothetical protein
MARGILEALMRNPRGWGMTGLASPEEGVNVPQDPMSPGEAAMKLIQRRAPGEAQEFIDQAPVNAALMAAGPVMGGIGKAAMAHPGITAALMGGAGLLTSTTEAGQPNLTRAQKRQMEVERQRNEQETAQKLKLMEAETAAAKARGANEAEQKSLADKQAAELAEYNSQVRRAEEARDQELGRERRFSDTLVGKGMDAMGGLAPAAAGLIGGGLSRLGTGPGVTALGKVGKGYALPILGGAALGATAANAPVAYDAFYTDTDNPNKAGYGAYARELPQSHPRKKEFGAYAAGLPDKNPVREQAGKEFYEGLAKRSGAGAIEGAGGGWLGADGVGAASRVGRALMGWMGGGKAAQPHWVNQTRVNGRFGPMKKR